MRKRQTTSGEKWQWEMNAKRFEIKVTPTFEMKEEMCRFACDRQDVAHKQVTWHDNTILFNVQYTLVMGAMVKRVEYLMFKKMW